MYARSAAPRPAPHTSSPRAPRLASLSTWTGTPSRAERSSRGLVPAQPGRIAVEPRTPDSTSIGPGTPSPTPTILRGSIPALVISSLTRHSARSSPCSAEASTSSGSASSASTRWARLPMATRRWVCPKSTPTTMPASPDSETLRARRPPEEVGVTSTVPPSFSSRTMLETVAAESPVLRAISACVSDPAMRTARTTRSRLARCSDDCDPGVSTPIHSRLTGPARPPPRGPGYGSGARPSVQHVNSKLSRQRCVPSRG